MKAPRNEQKENFETFNFPMGYFVSVKINIIYMG